MFMADVSMLPLNIAYLYVWDTYVTNINSMINTVNQQSVQLYLANCNLFLINNQFLLKLIFHKYGINSFFVTMCHIYDPSRLVNEVINLKNDENLKAQDAFLLCKINLFYVWDVSDSIHFTAS